MLPSMLAFAALPAGAADEVSRFALLVGANDGGAERVTLRYAHNDAVGMADIMTELGGVSTANEVLLLDPSTVALEGAIYDLNERLQATQGRREVIFYYSGHSDEEGLLLGEEHYPYSQLRAELDGLPADVRVAILDSCASGAMVRTKGGRRVAPFMVDESNRLDGFAIITSSAADEVAQEADRIAGSYFTYFLRSGLRGAADMSRDGRVTLDEAYAFAHSETLARTQRSEHGPQHANRGGGLDGQGQLVLTDLQLTSASLVLMEELDGRALIRDSDGQLVAELLKPAGREVELGLGSGEYDVVFTTKDGGRYAVARIVLQRGQSLKLKASDLEWFTSERTVARGDAPEIDPPQASLIEPRKTRRLGPRFQLFPGLPPTPKDDGVDRMLLGLGAAHARRLHGLGVSMGAVVVDQESEGLQLSLGFNSAGSLRGSQVSLGSNVARHRAAGIQGTLGGNVAGGGMDGVQVSLGGNLSGKDLRGVQVTLGYNHAGSKSRGLQGSLGANVVTGELVGAQVALGLNVARDLGGLQLSTGLNLGRDVKGVQGGMVNAGRDVQGLQIGLVNVGRDVRGGQIGLLNFARDVKGVSLGLLSFEREGRHDLLFYATESEPLNVDFKLGGKHLHTIIAAGIQPNQVGWVGLGYGGHITAGKRLWFDIEGLWQGYLPVGTFTQTVDQEQVEFRPFTGAPTQVARGRISVGVQLARQLALFGGVQMGVRIPVGSQKIDIAPAYLVDPEVEVLAWPGAFLGVQF